MNLKNLYPGRMVSSVYEMDWEKLALTYRGVIFDIDNTLVPHGAPADDRAKELFSRLHGLGMKTALVSNNGEERVRPFAEEVESIYLYKAGKPKRDGYEKAMQQMGTDTEIRCSLATRFLRIFLGETVQDWIRYSRNRLTNPPTSLRLW